MKNNRLDKPDILITGGMGYVGSFTSKEYFKKYKKKILSIDKLYRSNPSSKKFCKNLNFDISNEKQVSKLIRINKISKIIHLASYTCVRESIKKPKLYKNNNLIKQKKFIDTAKKCGVKKFLFSSSLSIYEGNKIKKNLSPYSKYKLQIENYLKKISDKQFKTIIVRYPNISGADNMGLLGDRNHKINRIFKTIFKKIINKKVFNLYCQLNKDIYPSRIYAHVEDIAKINIQLINTKNTKKDRNFKIFNIVSKLNVSNYQIFLKMQKLMKKKGKIKFKQADQKENFFPPTAKDNETKKLKIKSKKTTFQNIINTNIAWFKNIKKEL